MSPLPNQAHASQISIDPDLWHKRLGHPSHACLQLVSSLLPIPIKKSHSHSYICPKAKQTRLPFHLSTIKSHSPFNLLHCDIWDPYKTSTHFRKRFYLTIVDDYNKFTWLFLTNHKYDISYNHSLLLDKINFRHLLKPSVLTTDCNLFLCVIFFFSKKY